MLKHKFTLVLLLIFLMVPSVVPLLSSGFYPMHDDTQVARVYEMTKSLKDGVFPVRWVHDLGYGYGYPIFNFYAPFAYYIGGFSGFLTDALTATKIVIAMGVLLSGVSMFLLGAQLWGPMGAAIASVLYVYAPYHALDTYVRGDIAELYGYAFVPLVFLGLFRNKSRVSFPIAVVGFALVILSHNLTAYMTGLFILLWFIIKVIVDKGVSTKTCLAVLALLLGVGISAFYSMPALLEMRYTNVLSQIGGGADFHEHFVCANQLWDSPWGFGGSVNGCIDGMSFKIGKLHLFLLSISLMSLFIARKRLKEKMIIIFLIIGAVFSVFLTLEGSKAVWEKTPFMAFLQYPWRFLLFTSFFISLLSGGIVHLRKQSGFVIMALCIITVLFNLKLFSPQKIVPVTVSYYTSETALKWTASKISDEFMPVGFKKPGRPQEVVKNKIQNQALQTSMYQDKTGLLAARIKTKESTLVHINTAYFPAWTFTVDGKEVVSIVSSNGMEVVVPGADHILSSQFVQTPIEKLANVISLASVGMLIVGIIYRRKILW